MQQAETAGQFRWLPLSRRKLLGRLLVGTGALAAGARIPALAQRLKQHGHILLEHVPQLPPGLEDATRFTLMEALYGRRSRRFGMGMEIPDGVLAFKSTKPPVPLDRLEQLLVLTAAAGNTGWHHLIYRDPTYAPSLSNYAASAGGRTFPSPAGWQVTNFFYTDDKGVYYFPTRDAPSLAERDGSQLLDLNAWLQAHRSRIRKLSDGRLYLPAREPYIDGHNTWVANRPGTTSIIPVIDNAQVTLNALAFFATNGYCIFDDVNNRRIPGIERFKDLVDIEHPWPLSVLEREAFAMGNAELVGSCYAGALMLQALGLGGWMYSGIDMYAVLGASGDPKVPGLGFRFDKKDGWPVPNVTGREGVYEGYCPPHFRDMRAAVEALAERKFGPGGPFHPKTPGPWKDTAKVRAAAQDYSDRYKECVTAMAQYTYDTFGKFPGTVPTMYALTYLQAHHMDLDFYDRYFKEAGGYLETHARHMERWHSDRRGLRLRVAQSRSGTMEVLTMRAGSGGAGAEAGCVYARIHQGTE